MQYIVQLPNAQGEPSAPNVFTYGKFVTSDPTTGKKLRRFRDAYQSASEPWSVFCERFTPPVHPSSRGNSWRDCFLGGPEKKTRFLVGLVFDVFIPEHDRVERLRASTLAVPFLAHTWEQKELRVLVPFKEPVHYRVSKREQRRRVGTWVARAFQREHAVDMCLRSCIYNFVPTVYDFVSREYKPAVVIWRDGPLPTWDELLALATTKTKRGGA